MNDVDRLTRVVAYDRSYAVVRQHATPIQALKRTIVSLDESSKEQGR